MFPRFLPHLGIITAYHPAESPTRMEDVWGAIVTVPARVAPSRLTAADAEWFDQVAAGKRAAANATLRLYKGKSAKVRVSWLRTRPEATAQSGQMLSDSFYTVRMVT